MKTAGTYGAALTLAFLMATAVRADTLASYPFTGSSLASTDGSTISTAADIALGSGLTDTTRFATSVGNPAPALRINTDETDGTSFPTAITADNFFTVNITPAAGDHLSLTTLTFDLGVNSALIVSNVRVQESIDGSTYVAIGTISAFSTTSFTGESIDLTVGNAALLGGSPVYLRFVVYDNANNANGYTAFDNVVVSGTSTALVPEPGTNAMLALGALSTVGVFVGRRRALGRLRARL